MSKVAVTRIVLSRRLLSNSELAQVRGNGIGTSPSTTEQVDSPSRREPLITVSA